MNMSAKLDEVMQKLRDEYNTVHIISTPFGGGDKAKCAGADKACEVTCRESDHIAREKVYVFNPNHELSKLAVEVGMSSKQQAARWLEMWMKVMKLAKEKNGNVYVMTHRRRGILGEAQHGEIEAAKIADFLEDNGRLIYVEYDEEWLPGTLSVKVDSAYGLKEMDPYVVLYITDPWKGADNDFGHTPMKENDPEPVWDENNGFDIPLSKEVQNLWIAIADDRQQRLIQVTEKLTAIQLCEELELGAGGDLVEKDWHFSDGLGLRVSFKWEENVEEI